MFATIYVDQKLSNFESFESLDMQIASPGKNNPEREEKDLEGGAPQNAEPLKKEKLIDWEAIKQFFMDLKAFMVAASSEEAKYQHKIEKELHEQIKPAVKFGGVVVLITIGFFVVWSGLAPLDSAATAEGHIVLSGNHKTIQHLEGGVIEQILIEEGDVVQDGQELIILNSTQARARVQALLSQLRIMKAIEKRLVAEEKGAKSIDFEDPVLDREEAEVQMLIKNQTALFELSRKALKLQADIVSQRVAQKSEDVKGLEARLKSYISQLELAREQLIASQKLFDQGLELKPKLIHAKNSVTELEGRIHETKAGIARAKEEIAENELHKVNNENDFKQKVAEKYKETHASVLELQQNLQAAEDVLKRTVIRAPRSGIITGLQYHTIGGVIHSGGKVMDIVPQDDKLIVEAFVQTKDIESIRVGLEAKITLNAFKSRLVPRISGEVIYVSADKFTNDKTGMPYYLTKIEIKEETIAKINSDVTLYPGMPVTVFIVKGTRTFLQYLLSPIVDSFHKAFKEA